MFEIDKKAKVIRNLTHHNFPIGTELKAKKIVWGSQGEIFYLVQQGNEENSKWYMLDKELEFLN